MVGIVVVSHSRALARAAVALAQEMVPEGQVAIAIAAGLDDDTFGTDATRIVEAIAEADSGDGVVVLMDLGSAVLSAELALELLDDDARERVLLCPAPLVEGLVVAAVTAMSGAPRSQIAAEATAALEGKQSQLQPAERAETTPAPERAVPAESPAVAAPGSRAETDRESAELGAEPAVVRFVVSLPHGLHARPAARLVALAQEGAATGTPLELRNLTTGSDWVPGASLSRVATLGVLTGHEVQARASGPGADDVLHRLAGLARAGFGEAPDRATASAPPAPASALPSCPPLPPASSGASPMAASPGIGIGVARHQGVSGPSLADASSPAADSGAAAEDRDPAGEQRRLDDALATARAQIGTVQDRLAQQVSPADAEIFGAHRALLDDDEILAAARSRIMDGADAARAWAVTITRTAARFEALPDPYQRARASDVTAVGEQVLALLARPTGPGPEAGTDRAPSPDPSPAGPAEVLIARDLTPAQAAELDQGQVAGVVLAFGSPAAHSVILLRARGIPAVTGAGAAVLEIPDGTSLVVDGGTGELLVAPADDTMTAVRARVAAAARRDQRARSAAGHAAVTRDGVQVLVGANVGSPEQARAAADAGADVVGLVRTEFLFLDRTQAPSTDEQEEVYRAIAEPLAGRRITLRTLDAGGDKPLPYLPMPAELNPFLGVRGLRLSLQQPGLLASQLLAMVRVARDVPVSIMFPMVSTLHELVRARAILAEVISREGRGEPAGLQVGIMVEVPAAALRAASLAPHVDFFSIGTNDLTQYTVAAERGNAALAELADPLDPAVLALISATCRGAGPRLVAVCGELAADELAAKVLAGLGVRELSVTPRAIPGVKESVRELDLTAAAIAGRAALEASSAAEVRDLLRAGGSGTLAGPTAGSVPD